jgi:predicted O-methyltransferase YrrM
MSILIKFVNFSKLLSKKIYHYLDLIHPPTRATTFYVKSQKKKNLCVVEIGTELGLNAITILQELSIQKLFLIDPYEDYVMANRLQKIGNDQMKEAAKRLSKYKNKTIFIRKYSVEAINDVPDNIDFVYIDANHDYSYVKKDIELYYKKIKNGGVIGGHDFSSDTPGVCKAVLEFVDRNSLNLMGDERDWWIVKP